MGQGEFAPEPQRRAVNERRQAAQIRVIRLSSITTTTSTTAYGLRAHKPPWQGSYLARATSSLPGTTIIIFSVESWCSVPPRSARCGTSGRCVRNRDTRVMVLTDKHCSGCGHSATTHRSCRAVIINRDPLNAGSPERPFRGWRKHSSYDCQTYYFGSRYSITVRSCCRRYLYRRDSINVDSPKLF